MTNGSHITVRQVDAKLDDHKTWHKDVGDKALDKHDILLMGEKGDNGIVKDLNDLKNYFNTLDTRLKKFETSINWGVLIVLASFIAALANLVMK